MSGLSRLGIVVNRDWLATAERVLKEKRVAARDLVDAVVEQFLFADLNVIGLKALPQHVERMHDCRLTGSFVLQVQEAFNMGEPLERRNVRFSYVLYCDVWLLTCLQKDTSNTCLKLWLTDGHQRVVGFEYKKIGALKVETPVGYKVCCFPASDEPGCAAVVLTLAAGDPRCDGEAGRVDALSSDRVCARWRGGKSCEGAREEQKRSGP